MCGDGGLKWDMTTRNCSKLISSTVPVAFWWKFLRKQGEGGFAAGRRRGKGWTSPSVKECLDDLGADGVAGQIRDRREVLPPEGIKGHFFQGVAHGC